MPPSFTQRAAARCINTLPALFLCAAAAFVAGAAVAPPPEPSPVPKRWQLDIETSNLRTTVVNLPDGPRAYYYLTYTVTNNSPMDLLFAPSFELATDEMAVLRSGRDVPMASANTLLDRLENPLLHDQIKIVGPLLRGEENAKDGLVMWPLPSLHGSELTVYAAGFSGETAIYELPNPETGEPEKKVLRKTLMLKYRLPGEIQARAGGIGLDLEPYEKSWIMR